MWKKLTKQEEIVVSSEIIANPFSNLDFVVKAFKFVGRKRILNMSNKPIQTSFF